MLTPTHLVAAQTAYLAACVLSAHQPTGEEAAVAMLGAVLPDLDSRASYIGRILRLTSDLIERHFGHRSFTHSLLIQAIAGGLAWWLIPHGYALALIVGWVSHSWCDMMTPSGVAWFWPARIRCVLPGNPSFRMDTGGGGELGFLAIVALIGIVMMPLASTGKGTSGLVRAALGQLEGARSEYDRDKGGFAFEVQVVGRDNRSDADISGRYPVRGPWREAGLILDTPDGPRSLCPGSQCDWIATSAVLERGEPIQTVALAIRGKLASAETVAAALAPWRERGTILLLGELKLAGVGSAPPTVETAGETVTLVYADPEILDRWRGKSLRDLALTAQIRAPAGAALPSPTPVQLREPPRIDPLLQRWLQPPNWHDPL
jgi:inner membrane protein